MEFLFVHRTCTDETREKNKVKVLLHIQKYKYIVRENTLFVHLNL